MQVLRINYTVAKVDNCADIWRAPWGPEGETIYRPYPHVFGSRQQDLVPQFPGG